MNIVPIYKTLSADAELVAILGDRMYPTVAPKGTRAPYLVWSGMGSTPENQLDCGATNENSRIQFVVWHIDARKAEEIRLKASKILNTAGFYYEGEHPDNHDEETNLHGRGWDMNYWLDR